MKSIIITGATSFLGRNVLCELVKHDYKIYAFVREDSADLWRLPKHNRIEYIYGSLDELKVVLHYVKEADYFFHFAWDGKGYEGRQSEEKQNKNIIYSMNALKLAKLLGCRQFVFSGSQAEYGCCREMITEETEANPISAYGKAKLEFSTQAMQYCMHTDMQFIHLRIFSVYGPDDRTGTLVDTCVRNFNDGKLAELGPCTQSWNFLYIKDFVSAMMCLIEKGCKTGVYNLASEDTRVLSEFVLEIYKLSNQTGEYRFGKESDNPEGSPELQPSINKIKDAIGWYPRYCFADGIKCIMKEILKGE